MMNHSSLYSGAEDCKWLRETAFRGYDDIPAFESFTIAGHEDCPLEILLYAQAEPTIDEDAVAFYVLEDAGLHNNLSHYVRK